MRRLLIVLALIAGPALAAEPEGKFVPPDWLKKPSSEEMRAVAPPQALARGIDGKATLRCVVTERGLLESCKVASETPAGEGFGQAALLLAPSFVMKPATLDGRPVRSTVNIPIVLNTSALAEDTGSRLPPPVRAIDMVTDPVWDQAPSFAELVSAWPAGAQAGFGHVSMRCRLTAEGRLHACDVLTETPRRQGFGKAAREIVAPKFKMRVSEENAKAIDGAYINLPIRFINPADSSPPSIVKPKWITRLDPEKVAAVYPAKAADAGIKAGLGVADCVVAPDGALTDCKPARAEPEGYGFAQSAVIVASLMRMNPWSDGGGPVDGVRLRLPIRFNLAPQPVPPAKAQ